MIRRFVQRQPLSNAIIILLLQFVLPLCYSNEVQWQLALAILLLVFFNWSGAAIQLQIELLWLAVIIKCATYAQYANVLAMHILIRNTSKFLLVMWHN